jgi:hypothetical protein
MQVPIKIFDLDQLLNHGCVLGAGTVVSDLGSDPFAT